ncbi:MAG: DUF4345 domain-containing protein [bacterium]|nr:DUF4345 domain-containing protein [bacterium]
MTATKIYLTLSVLIWLPYGIYCALVPGFLDATAGVVGATPTGTTELRAMYGGLQASIGALCAFALAREQHARSAVLAVAFLVSGLFVARIVGLAIDGSGSGYTHGALVFEGAYAIASIVLLRRSTP